MPTVKITAISLVLFCLAGCIDENIIKVSEDLEITSSYSIPIGPLTYDINDYLEELDSVNVPWPDSLYFNDVLLPNYRSYYSRGDFELLNFGGVGNTLDKIESVMFRLIISNGYPTMAVTQIYFADENRTYLDSVSASGPYVIEAAPIDTAGIVTAPNEKILDVYMGPDFVDNMPNVRFLIIESVIYTTRPDITRVRFYSDYTFNVHIAARIKLRFNTNEL